LSSAAVAIVILVLGSASTIDNLDALLFYEVLVRLALRFVQWLVDLRKLGQLRKLAQHVLSKGTALGRAYDGLGRLILAPFPCRSDLLVAMLVCLVIEARLLLLLFDCHSGWLRLHLFLLGLVLLLFIILRLLLLHLLC